MADTRTRTRRKSSKSTKAAAAMTPARKAAMAEGRNEAQVIRRYLEALVAEAANRKPTRGHPWSPAGLAARIANVEARLAAGSLTPLATVLAEQERLDLKAEQRRIAKAEAAGSSTARLVDQFVEAVGPYSAKRGLTRAAWRKVGVPLDVLKRAGL